MKITSIREQKHDSGRASIFLDEKFWLGVSLSFLEELSLRVGDEISKEEKAKIEELSLADKALSYALNRISYSLISKKALIEKIEAKGFSEELARWATNRCEELGLLDDSGLAENIIASRRERGQGKRKVKETLREKGIERELVDGLIEEHFLAESEEDEAERSFLRKFKNLPLNPKETVRAEQYLIRQGFSSISSRKVATKYKMSAEEEEREYGSAQALEVLEKHWPFQKPERNKAKAYLLRQGFSYSAADQAINDWLQSSSI